MKHEYNDKAMVLEHPCDEYKYLINPLSRNAIEYLESLGGTIVDHHNTNKEYGGFNYKVTFPNTVYGLSIIKNYGSYGFRRDQFEVAVMHDEDLCYDTDITNDVLGFMEEEDVLTIARLVMRLDEDGHIRPLTAIETSQNEQLA